MIVLGHGLAPAEQAGALSTHQDRLLHTYAHVHLSVHLPFGGSNPFCPLF